MRFLLRALGLLAALTIGAALAISWWVLRPKVLERYVLDSIEERTGVDIDVGGLHLGLDGIMITDVAVFEPKRRKGDKADNRDADPPRVLTAKAVAVRPEWRDLLFEQRVVISYAALEGLDLGILREENGDSNLARLIAAFTPESDSADEPPPPSEEEEPAAEMALDRVVIEAATIRFTDFKERPRKPIRLTLEVTELTLRGLSDPAPTSFSLASAVTLGTDTHAKVDGTGTVRFSPFAIDTDLTLDEVNVDTLVPSLTNPENDDVPGPYALDGIRVDGRLRVGRVQYEGFVFTDARATARLDGSDLTVSELDAKIADGTAKITADIDFGRKGFHYTATAQLQDVHLAKAGGLLEPIAWGRVPDPEATIEVQLEMAGTTDKKLLETIDLQGKVRVDALDLDTVLGRYAGGPSRDLGPYETGKGTMKVTLDAGRVRANPYDLTDVQAEATLADSRLNVARIKAQVAEGTLDVSADVDLTQPGLTYSGTIALTEAQAEPLSAPFAGQGFGTRTGVVGLNVTLEGQGTDTSTLLEALDADGRISWTNGRVANSDYLKEIANITGIPGFRDLVVENSGGKFQVRKGVFSTKRLRIWGPDAGIQGSGSIQPNLQVNSEVALGIGPNSNRELFSTGIALPYVNGKNGWRFIPLHVTGTLLDPSMTIPPRAVIKSALTTVPSAGVGVVSTGLGAVRGGTRAVLEGTRSILPGSGSATRGAESAVNGGTGLVEGAFTSGANAVGSVLSGIGGLFGDDEDDEDPEDDAQTKNAEEKNP